MPRAEQRLQQHHLRLRRVLILIEQHHPEAVPFGRGDLRVVVRHGGRAAQLVTEVHRLQCRLALRVRAHQRQQCEPAALAVEHILDRLEDPAAGRAFHRGGEAEGESLDVVRVAKVLGELAGKVQDLCRGAGLAERVAAHLRAVVLAHRRVGQLPARRLGE
jgi:hypothetical protein